MLGRTRKAGRIESCLGLLAIVTVFWILTLKGIGISAQVALLAFRWGRRLLLLMARLSLSVSAYAR